MGRKRRGILTEIYVKFRRVVGMEGYKLLQTTQEHARIRQLAAKKSLHKIFIGYFIVWLFGRKEGTCKKTEKGGGET